MAPGNGRHLTPTQRSHSAAQRSAAHTPSCTTTRIAEGERVAGRDLERGVPEERGVQEVRPALVAVGGRLRRPVPRDRVTRVRRVVEQEHAGLATVAGPLRSHHVDGDAEDPLVLGAVGEQEAGVGPVGAAPEREAAVAAPGRELGAVEHDVDLRREGDAPVDGVGVVVELDVGQRSLVDQHHRLAVGTDPVDRGGRDVAQDAVGVVLLPEVLTVDVLDREPQAVVPRVVLGASRVSTAPEGDAQRVHVGPLAMVGVVGPHLGHGSHPP